MGVLTEEYRTFTAYICKSPYTPGGVCYPYNVSSKGISVSDKTYRNIIKVVGPGGVTAAEYVYAMSYVSVTAYLYTEAYQYLNASVYILPEGKTPLCLVNTVPCLDVTDGSTVSSWDRDDVYINVYLPELKTCGVTGFKTVFSDAAFSLIEPAHKGEITSLEPEYTFNVDGYCVMSYRLDRTDLIPGHNIYVYYSLDGFDGWFLLGLFSFQTDIFSGAVVKGCGLCDRVKVYNDPYRPQDGYTYKYVPSVGGIGSEFTPEWLFDTRLRWAVSFEDEIYWLQSVSPCFFEIGQTAGIIKSVSELPDEPDKYINSKMVKKTLSESSGRIAPEYWY